MQPSDTLSYLLKCEISPILKPKFNQFGMDPLTPLPRFSNENLLRSSNLPFSTDTPIYPDFTRATKSPSFESALKVKASGGRTNYTSIPSMKINSTLFKSPLLVNNDITQKKIKPIRILKRESYYLNEIAVNGYRLQSFPFVGLSEECCVVGLSNKLMMNKKYFEVIKAPGHLRKASSIYNNKTVSIADMKANNVYYYENETSVKKIIARFYSDIKEVLRLIEKNYLNKRHKLYNEKNCFLLEILIRNCNEFINFVQLLPREHRVTFNRICPTNKRNMKVFVCEFCRNIFKNGQSLGGHISQKHPKQSMKYKTKLEIRKQRTEQRNMIILCRKRILYQYGYNYEVLMQKKNMHLIRSVINSHREEYKKLIYEMKRKQLMC